MAHPILINPEARPDEVGGKPVQQSEPDYPSSIQAEAARLQNERDAQLKNLLLGIENDEEPELDPPLDPPRDPTTAILSARGAFYFVKLADTYGPGVYSIDELNREVTAPGDNYYKRPGAMTSPILLTSVEFNQVDITSQMPCLNNVKVFYTFGQNFGEVMITGEILLGPLGDINYDGVNRLISFFWKHRVSVKHLPVAVNVADNSYFVYLTGLRIHAVVADFHIMPFTLYGTLLDLEREKASIINVRGEVITGGKVHEPSLFKALQAEPPEPEQVSRSKKPEAEEAENMETEKLSLGEDPPLYQGAESSPENAGPAQHPLAIEVGALLSNEPQPQEGQDLKYMMEERARLEAAQTRLEVQAAQQGSPSEGEHRLPQLFALDETIPVQEKRVAPATNLLTNTNACYVENVFPKLARKAADIISDVKAGKTSFYTPGREVIDWKRVDSERQ